MTLKQVGPSLFSLNVYLYTKMCVIIIINECTILVVWSEVFRVIEEELTEAEERDLSLTAASEEVDPSFHREFLWD